MSRSTGRLVVAGLAVVATVALSSCGVSTDTAPRDLAPAAADPTEEVDETGSNTATGAGRVFFVQADAAGVPSRLVAVARDVAIGRDSDPTGVLDVLIDGPNDAERADGITSLLPPDVPVLGWASRPGGVVAIDLGPELVELTGSNLILALAQIVYTVTESAGVDGVRITVEGRAEDWPDGNGQLQGDALTVFDYPGLLRSSQPAFPAIPSGRPDSG